jgi:hypothetical protein
MKKKLEEEMFFVIQERFSCIFMKIKVVVMFVQWFINLLGSKLYE